MQHYFLLASKTAGFVYAWIQSFLASKQKVSDGKVLLIIDGHLGDGLVLAQGIERVVQHYHNAGKAVYLFCGEQVWRALQMLVDTSSIQYCGVKGLDSKSTLKTVIKAITALRNLKVERTISFPGKTLYYYYLGAMVPAAERWIVMDDIPPVTMQRRLRAIMYQFYSHRICVSLDTPYTERMKRLLQELGVPPYERALIPLPSQCVLPKRDMPYCTITIDSMNVSRRWPTERFVELISLLLERHAFDIVLLGNQVPEEMLAQYNHAFSSEPRVVNRINQTGFHEWIELIRGAEFHVGIDSGSIHVAAYVGTQSYCLTGVWDGHQIMPYSVDREVPGTTLPICIYADHRKEERISCYGCATISDYGYSNPECSRMRKEGKPCLCLQEITVQQVLDVIEGHLVHIR